MIKTQQIDASIVNELRQNDLLDIKIQQLNFEIAENTLLKDFDLNDKEMERRKDR